MKKILKIIGINLLVFVCLVLLCLGGYEIYLRVQMNANDQVKTVVDKPIYLNDPHLGWYHKSNITFDYNGGESFLNRFGHRDEEITALLRNQNKVLMLGDSFTFGMNVAQDQTMTADLQKKVDGKRWDFMNAGVIGYSIRQELIYLREHFDEIQPKVVILNVFVGNDLTEQRRTDVTRDANDFPVSIYDKEVFVLDPGYLASRTTLPLQSLALADIMKRWKDLAMSRNAYPGYIWAVFLDKDHPSYPSDIDWLWQEYEGDLIRMKKLLDEKGAQLLVVIIPMDVQVDRKYWDKYPTKVFGEKEFSLDLPQKKFREICERNSLTCLDLLPIFREHRQDELYFAEIDPHFDVAGNRLAAESIFDKLKPLLTSLE